MWLRFFVQPRHTRPPLFPNGLTLQVYKLQTPFVSKEKGQYVRKSGYQGNSAGEPPDPRAPIKKTVLLFVPAAGSFLQALDTHFLPSVLSPQDKLKTFQILSFLQSTLI